MSIIQQVIQENYDLGTVQLPEQLPQAHQRRHRKMTVQTDKGKFLVKTYSTDLRELDNLRFQHRLSGYLREHDLPAPHIERAKDGKGIVEQDNWAMELQGFIDGGPMRITVDTLTCTATALGRFHEICRDYPVPPRDARMWRFSDVPRDIFQRLYEMAYQQCPEQRIIDECNTIARFLHEAQEILSIEQRDKFETGLIHGDWHGGNLMFKEEELVGIVDFEFSGAGCFLEDIAYGVSNLCIRRSTEEKRLATRVNIFLDNYQLSRTLSYDELVALYYAVGIKHCTTVAYQCKQAGGTIAGLTAAQWIDTLSQQCLWLAEASRKARFGES